VVHQVLGRLFFRNWGSRWWFFRLQPSTDQVQPSQVVLSILLSTCLWLVMSSAQICCFLWKPPVTILLMYWQYLCVCVWAHAVIPLRQFYSESVWTSQCPNTHKFSMYMLGNDRTLVSDVQHPCLWNALYFMSNTQHVSEMLTKQLQEFEDGFEILWNHYKTVERSWNH